MKRAVVVLLWVAFLFLVFHYGSPTFRKALALRGSADVEALVSTVTSVTRPGEPPFVIVTAMYGDASGGLYTDDFRVPKEVWERVRAAKIKVRVRATVPGEQPIATFVMPGDEPKRQALLLALAFVAAAALLAMLTSKVLKTSHARIISA